MISKVNAPGYYIKNFHITQKFCVPSTHYQYSTYALHACYSDIIIDVFSNQQDDFSHIPSDYFFK